MPYEVLVAEEFWKTVRAGMGASEGKEVSGEDGISPATTAATAAKPTSIRSVAPVRAKTLEFTANVNGNGG